MEKFEAKYISLLLRCFIALVLFSGVGNGLKGQDYDGDGIADVSDNCPTTPNADQIDKDQDGVGDACENPSLVDVDLDEWPDNLDNCRTNNNNTQFDHDNDGVGNYCDPDLYNCATNPPTCLNGGIVIERPISNPRSAACLCLCPSHFTDSDCSSSGSGPPNYPSYPISSDRDGDGVLNVSDNAPYMANSSQTDTDSDGVGDATDNCYLTANASQTDTDGDGIGDACESFVFPVTLLSYQAKLESGRIHLTWTTGEEVNNHSFILEKSTDGKEFVHWKEVLAEGGDRQTATSYEIWDNQVSNLIFHYYRLSQVDLDGTSRIIGIAEVDTRPYVNILPEIKLFPNPVENPSEISLHIKDPYGEETKAYQAQIFNNQGNRIGTYAIPGDKTVIGEYSLNLSTDLPAGLYFLSISSGRWARRISFVKK